MHERETVGDGGWLKVGDIEICVLMSKKSNKKSNNEFQDTCSKAFWQLSATMTHAGRGSGDLRSITQQLCPVPTVLRSLEL